MRAILQRVTTASVAVDGEMVGAIGPGVCIFVSVGPADTEAISHHLAERVATLRIHADESGRMNRDLGAGGGAALVVPQFTLHAETHRGHRPSFDGAAARDRARALCDAFAEALRSLGLEVACGQFGAHMHVEIHNDGPVTIVLSSGEDPWNADAG
ncbi:MAG: D-aminoacyl-tRNA deacylase [Candidatus Dormibacteria bacterium]